MEIKRDYFLPGPELLDSISVAEILTMQTEFEAWWNTLGGAFVKRMLDDGLGELLTSMLSLASSATDEARLESARCSGRIDIILAMLDPNFSLKDRMDSVIETLNKRAKV